MTKRSAAKPRLFPCPTGKRYVPAVERGILTLGLALGAACSAGDRPTEEAAIPTAPAVEVKTVVETRVAEPVEFSLFLPHDAFAEIHADALRFDQSDSSLLQGCWLFARSHVAEPGNEPVLTRSKSQRTIFFFPPDLHADVSRTAVSMDRSMSWLLIKAWKIARPELAELAGTPEAFHEWARAHRND